MAWRERSMFLSGFASILSMLAVVPLAARQPQLPAINPTPSDSADLAVNAVPRSIELLAGQWSYNPDESINIATGRPEQAPRSATQRTPGARAGGSGGGIRPGPVSGRAAGSSSDVPSDGTAAPRPSRLFAPGEMGPTLSMMQESRSLRRDLMEVPEALTINVTNGAVSFTDDLDRTRVYDTTGLKQKYQLGAARFSASTVWQDSQLRKHIEAADGFRMSETYFLSPDGERLFVIVRLGDPKKGPSSVGVNRVYDRIH
jgi:hypothetical protein